MFHLIEELAEDYDAALKIQQQAIDAQRARLHEALSRCDFAEIKHRNTVLRMLYDEKDELVQRRKELRSYINRVKSKE